MHVTHTYIFISNIKKMKERVVGLESECWVLHFYFSLGMSNCKVLNILSLIRLALVLLILVTLVIIFILGASLLKTVLVRVSGDFLLYWISPSNLHYMLSTLSYVFPCSFLLSGFFFSLKCHQWGSFQVCWHLHCVRGTFSDMLLIFFRNWGKKCALLHKM